MWSSPTRTALVCVFGRRSSVTLSIRRNQRQERTIALGPKLADELFQHRGKTAYQDDEDRVFCHPQTGGPLDHKRYAETLRAALKRANVERYVRPFHDGRHSSITNSAAAGLSPAALMARAGHSDFKTTQLYIDLAGETFRAEAELLEQRLFGPAEAEKTPTPSRSAGRTVSENTG